MRVAVPGSNSGERFAEYEKERALLVSAVSTRTTGRLVRRESGDVSRAVRPGMAGPGPHLFSAADCQPQIFAEAADKSKSTTETRRHREETRSQILS